MRRQRLGLRAVLLALFVTWAVGIGVPAQATRHKPKLTHHHPPKTHHQGDKAHQAAAAPTPPEPAVEPVEAVEAVEDVAPVQAIPTEADATAANVQPRHLSWWSKSIQAMGHMHAAVIHLPIAWVVLWFVFEVLAAYGSQYQLRPATAWIGVATALSFIPATLTGLWRYAELATATADPHAMDPARLHRNIMYVCIALCAVALVLRLVGEEKLPRHWQPALVATLGATCAAISFAAHLGGRLVYGDDFFLFP